MRRSSIAAVHAFALSAALAPCIATTALAQQDPPPPAAADPGSLPPLPPLPPPAAAEPPRPEAPADTMASAVPRPPPPLASPRPPAPPAHPDAPVREWYGWQIILTDCAAFASVLASSSGSGWGDLAAVLYLGGGPVVHFAHQNVAKGAGSLGLRVGAPFGGALVGALLGAIFGGTGNRSGEVSPAVVGAGVGVLGGFLAASILDVAVLAYDDVPTGSRAAARSEPLRLRLAPVATLPRDSTGHVAPALGVVGSF